MNDLIADVAWALRDALVLTEEADDPDVDPEVVLRAAAQRLILRLEQLGITLTVTSKESN